MKKVNLFLVGLVTMLGLPLMVNAETIEVNGDLQTAITGASENDTIKLTGPITTGQITVDKALTIDLNGNTITGNSKYVFAFDGNGKNFTITDTSSTPGSITNADRGVLVTDGTLTIDKVTITSSQRVIQVNPVDDSDKAKVIINGGKIEATSTAKNTRAIMLWGNNIAGAASLEMNGGEVIAPVAGQNSTGINIGNDGAAGTTAVINAGTITAYNGIRLYGNGQSGMTTLTMNGGTINASSSGIINAADGATDIKVYGGVILASELPGSYPVGGDSVAIQHGKAGFLVIGKNDGTGPHLVGETGVAIKEGTIIVNGGYIEANGVYREVAAERLDGTEDTGAAISVTSNSESTGKASVTINGGEFLSNYGNALYEGIAVNEEGHATTDKSAVGTLTIMDGTFTSYDGKDSVVATAYTEEDGFIYGGTFATDVSDYLIADVDLVQDEDGNYVVADEVSDVPPTDEKEEVENPETSDGILLFLGLTVVGFAGVALTYRRLHN